MPFFASVFTQDRNDTCEFTRRKIPADNSLNIHTVNSWNWLIHHATFFTGTSGFTCAMGFSPFMARMRFLTAVVAWRTTLS